MMLQTAYELEGLLHLLRERGDDPDLVLLVQAKAYALADMASQLQVTAPRVEGYDEEGDASDDEVASDGDASLDDASDGAALDGTSDEPAAIDETDPLDLEDEELPQPEEAPQPATGGLDELFVEAEFLDDDNDGTADGTSAAGAAEHDTAFEAAEHDTAFEAAEHDTAFGAAEHDTAFEAAEHDTAFGADSGDAGASAPTGRALRGFFSINDRFRFRRSLFNGADGEYDSALNVLERLASLDEAEDYLYTDLELNPDNMDVQSFVSILERYYDQV